MYTSVGSLILPRQEYPNLLHWGIWVPAQRSRSFYDLSFSEASRYPGKRTNVYHCESLTYVEVDMDCY